MKRILLAAVLGLICSGCGPSTQGQPPADQRITAQPKTTLRMTLVGFPGSESEKGLEANDALDRALHRFKQSHPNTAIVLTITPDAPDFSKAEPGADLAFIPARLLSDLVGKGGIEPLGARLSAEWLKDFPAESLAQCKAGGILFAVPWLKAEKPEDNWLLISFALSLHKPEAVELMKFLASDPAALSASRRQAGR